MQRRILPPFFAGLACAGALTAGLAMLLYTGNGFLRTAGLLLGVALGSLAAGLWAGDDSSESTRLRATVTVAVLTAAGVFAALWSASPQLRASDIGGPLAVLIVLALPAYATGSMFAGLQRHHGTPAGPAVGILAGTAIGVAVATAVLVPRLDAWGVFFAAAMLLVPSVIMPSRAAPSTDSGGVMRDRVVIITGAGHTGQMGFAIAQRFVAEGARVIVTGTSDTIRSVAAQLGERDQAAGVRADLTNADDVAAVIAAARAHGRLDALINVAGGLGVIESIEDTTAEMFRQEMSRNAETVLMMSRAALPMLRESRGAIVNFASPAGEHANARMGAYSAAKAAVIALTRSLALEEVSHGVRVNAIAPGLIDTEQNRASAAPDARFVTREQVAEVVLFLAGAASSGVTGEVVHVMGEGLG